MEERHAGVESLRKEVANIREGRTGKRIIWPAAIRDLAVGLVSGGISISEISSNTGIVPGTIRLWYRERQGKLGGSACFHEFGIGGVRHGGIAVKFRNGTEISGLGIAHIERFLKSGLL